MCETLIKIGQESKSLVKENDALFWWIGSMFNWVKKSSEYTELTRAFIFTKKQQVTILWNTHLTLPNRGRETQKYVFCENLFKYY